MGKGKEEKRACQQGAGGESLLDELVSSSGEVLSLDKCRGW